MTLSLDDLYLTHAERLQLAAEVHPLFATRGVPGTHAVNMAFGIIEDVLAGRAFEVPRFDKAFDDRSNEVMRISGPVDVLLFEGWCVGAAPQAVWVGREGHSYTFADGAMVAVSLDLQDRVNLDPKAIRARLYYGNRNDDALPGQTTRFGILTKIALALGVLFALFLWWMRRG